MIKQLYIKKKNIAYITLRDLANDAKRGKTSKGIADNAFNQKKK